MDSQATSSVRVHVVITNTSVQQDQDPPSHQVKEVTVKQGKTPPTVNQLILAIARGQNASLQLMILIDKMAGLSIGNYPNLSRSLLQFRTSLPITILLRKPCASRTGMCRP